MTKLKDEINGTLLSDNYTPDGAPKPVKDYITDYEASLGDGSRKYEGLETGLEAFDELIGGLNRFVLIAGMAGVGKSTLALQLALGVIRKEKIPVLFFSYEMSRRDVITMALQNISRKLTRPDIELYGRAKDRAEGKAEQLNDAIKQLTEIGDSLYVIDSHDGAPDMELIEKQVIALKAHHNSPNVMVVIDSIQDIVPTGVVQQTQAEAQTAQKLVELQHKTNCTILAIAQKNKMGVGKGLGYEGILGSVSFIHKPTTVLSLTGGKEALKLLKEKGQDNDDMAEALTDGTKKPDTPYPVVIQVIKGRNSGYGNLGLKYYGAYRYYEVGREKLFDELYEAIDSQNI